MEKRIVVLTLAFLLTIMLVEPIYAWGPYSHLAITFNALERMKGEPTSAYAIIMNNLDAFLCGLMFSDVSVVDYYTKFENYRATHNWAFVLKLKELAKTDDELAFVYGVAIHLVQDSIAHNLYIPEKIRSTLTRNDIIHPLVEGRIESEFVIEEYRVLLGRAFGSMPKYLPLVERALKRDFSKEWEFLKGAILGGKFYEDIYTVPKTPILFYLYEFAGNIIISLVGIGDCKPFLERSEIETMKYLRTEVHLPLDPTGIMSLQRADNEIFLMQLVFSIFIALLTLWRLGILGKIRG